MMYSEAWRKWVKLPGVSVWLSLVLVLFSPPLYAQALDQLRLGFDSRSGQPIQLLSCYRGCGHGISSNYRLDFQAGAPALSWRLERPELLSQLAEVAFDVQSRIDGEDAVWTVTSTAFQDGRRLQFRYRAVNGTFSLMASVRWLDPKGAELQTQPAVSWLIRPPTGFQRGTSGGFADSHEKIQWVTRLQDGWHLQAEQADTMGASWTGVRNRFWALLVNRAADRFDSGGAAFAATTVPLNLYLGPIDRRSLLKAGPELTGMLFTDLWFWMRWLSMAILICLNLLGEWFGYWGGAILLLSLVVKVAMTPLTMLAEHWQRQVNRIQSKLEPEIRQIKQQFKGEEQTQRILALHREQGVSLFYPLKSAFGFLIQIPVFIAAFNVLNECFGLNGVSFTFVADLAKPDHWLSLPFDLPFFGAHLNLMPLLMTAITLLASWQFHDPSLSPLLKRRQQHQLYMMAFLFLVLFYTFPAGMVLYWTTNNLVQYLKDSALKLRFRTEQRS